MDWHPISLEELNLIVDSTVDTMPIDLQARFKEIRGAFTQIICRRSDTYGLEKMFTIATFGKKAIIFDDVEEEFGIAVLPEDGGVLLRWELFPDLGCALRKLLEATSTS